MDRIKFVRSKDSERNIYVSNSILGHHGKSTGKFFTLTPHGIYRVDRKNLDTYVVKVKGGEICIHFSDCVPFKGYTHAFLEDLRNLWKAIRTKLTRKK